MNWALSSLHGVSLESTLTVPLKSFYLLRMPVFLLKMGLKILKTKTKKMKRRENAGLRDPPLI